MNNRQLLAPIVTRYYKDFLLLNLARYSVQAGGITRVYGLTISISDTIVCKAPDVQKGSTHTGNNLEIGGVYTVICDASHWFDTKTVKEFNAGDLSADGYSETTVECAGEALPAFTCYCKYFELDKTDKININPL